MSQDSEGINTIEQWKWSEMQGLELVPPPPPPPASEPNVTSFKGNPSPTLVPSTDDIQTKQGQEDSSVHSELGETREKMEVSEGKKDAGDQDKTGSSPPSSGFGELFRFADNLDYVLMGIGTVGAFVHGCSLPLFLRFFADLVNSFGSNANNIDKMTHEVLKVNAYIHHSQ